MAHGQIRDRFRVEIFQTRSENDMKIQKEELSAFGSFRALGSDANEVEREQLFRNVAQLFSFVCDRCDDNQVEQYDDVLCQLAELVEVEGRAEVAKMLAPLERAPGSVVIKLANDEIEVAQPILEFSNVLSDDDLIEIVGAKSEAHRSVIAGRSSVPERVGEAIVVHGGNDSVGRLVENDNARLGDATLVRLLDKANLDNKITENLRGRQDIDWQKIHRKIGDAGKEVRKKLEDISLPSDKSSLDQAKAVVFNRIQNRAGFNANSWRISWNQVKAMGDRKQLDEQSLVRFCRFGYGHHFGAAMASMLNLKQEVFVKWLAKQDYRAVVVAAKCIGMSPEVFEQGMMILPWRNYPSLEDVALAKSRFEELERTEAREIFNLWLRHEARNRGAAAKFDMAVGM